MMNIPRLIAGLGLALAPSVALADPAGAKPTNDVKASQPTSDIKVSPLIVTQPPAEGTIIRLEGEASIAVKKTSDGSFTFGDGMLIDTPLPQGYPDPTPPGVIELKTYPLVRRAQVTGTSAPDMGSNFAFWPLFRHIQSRKIEMTSPVEMNYTNANGNDEKGTSGPDDWTMSFLYRTPDQAPTGQDPDRKQVQVVDVPPITVIAMGVRGPYSFTRMRTEWRKLERWLSEQSTWDAAGEPRVFYYNGPDRRNKDKWAEVQIPVKLMKTSTPSTSATTAAPGPTDAGSTNASPASTTR